MADRSDEELTALAESGLHGQGAAVESTRRLREAVLKEEGAIRRLTGWLVGLTGILVILTLVIAFLTVILVKRGV